MKIITINVLLWIIILLTGTVVAQQKDPAEKVAQELIETVVKGCDREMISYCQSVTPGEGRMLACLYAHEDKLSGQCEYALFDAAAQLERAVAALSYLVNECGDDFDKHCGEVSAGKGRLLECLHKNEQSVSKRCEQALQDTGLK